MSNHETVNYKTHNLVIARVYPPVAIQDFLKVLRLGLDCHVGSPPRNDGEMEFRNSNYEKKPNIVLKLRFIRL